MIETIKSSKPIIFFECISEKNNLEIETVLKSHGYSFFIIDDTEGFLEKTENINPILDNNNNIMNRYINRLAIPKTKLNLINEFLN
jgi:hypothetical protein